MLVRSWVELKLISVDASIFGIGLKSVTSLTWVSWCLNILAVVKRVTVMGMCTKGWTELCALRIGVYFFQMVMFFTSPELSLITILSC